MRSLGLFLLAFEFLVLPVQGQGTAVVEFLDVGQGDAILIRSPRARQP